jgi:RNA polymerase primary sigma factor
MHPKTLTTAPSPVSSLELPHEEDTLAFWLDRIGRVPLLTAEQETALGRRARTGCTTSRERLVATNLRLVVSVAKRFANRGVPLLDLIQEGNLGLMKAVDRFDPERGYRFSTYATWWIRQAVARGLAAQGRAVRLPVHAGEALHKALAEASRLRQSLGREATADEIAQGLGISAAQVTRIMNAAVDPLSLDAPVGDIEGSSLGDVVADSFNARPDDEALRRLSRIEVEAMLSTLSSRERDVLRLRFGFADDRPHSLEEVARALSVTRERVRQIEKASLTKLRQPDCSAHIMACAS